MTSMTGSTTGSIAGSKTGSIVVALFLLGRWRWSDTVTNRLGAECLKYNVANTGQQTGGKVNVRLLTMSACSPLTELGTLVSCISSLFFGSQAFDMLELWLKSLF